MFDLTIEPRGQIYKALLRSAKQYCSSFSLTWSDQLTFNESAELIGFSLRPSLIRETYTNEWPGTRSLKHQAIVRHYRFTEDALQILLEVPSLYAWQAPDRPEDLALYRPDQACWLLSIAHEEDAAILDEPAIIDDLVRGIPGLMVRKHV